MNNKDSQNFVIYYQESFQNNLIDLFNANSHFEIRQVNTQILEIIDPSRVVFISLLLFLIGTFGIFFNRKHLILVLMSIELIFLGVVLNFISYSLFLNNIIGYIFALFALTSVGAEASIGFAILVAYFRTKGTISISSLNLLKG